MRLPKQVGLFHVPLTLWLLVRTVWAAPGPTGPLATNSDPFCSATNPVAFLGPPPPQPESTRRMIQRLAEIRKALDPVSVSFLSGQRAQLLAARVARSTNAWQEINLRYSLGETLTEAGRPEEALKQFKAVEDLARSLDQPMEERWRAAFRMTKAVALLRLGEQENCLLLHNAESCLFPLQPAAFHKATRGSRGAVAVLKEQLGKHPGDLSARWLLNIACMTP